MIEDMKEQRNCHDEEARWQALQERDADCDGRFVYGVRSTGIYCRPTCAARRPKRDQVVFFDTWEQAQQAGFRACKRCQPEQPLRPAAELVHQAIVWIEANEQPPSLKALGVYLGVSPYHLQRTFKAVTGLTPRQYAAALRTKTLKTQLREGQPVTGALYAAGYGSSSRLYESANDSLGMTPGAYRNGGSGMQINYTILQTTLGPLLLAATPRGICAVQFGENEQALEEALAAEFPRAKRVRADAALANWANALQESLHNSRPTPDLPLDVQGTAFQQQVWQILREIPRGETRTYTQVAEAAGRPKAVRAVARACASNPAALLIPCHRVVRTGGALAGYRWGLERKKKLLEQEKMSVEESAGTR